MAATSEQQVESLGTGVDGSFDRIVAVTDGEATGAAAVETAVELGAEVGATVDALYVVDTAHHWDIVVERAEATGEAAVERAAAYGDAAGVDVDKQFRYGSTADEVAAFSDAHGADLVVVGSERPTGLDRLVSPETVVPRLRRATETPVLVVEPDDDTSLQTEDR